MYGGIILHNVKRELSIVNRLLRLKSRQIHSIASSSTIKITGPNIAPDRRLCSRSLTTNVLLRNLDGKLKNDATEQHSNIAPFIDSDDFISFLNDCVWNKKEDVGLNALLNQRKQNTDSVISLECFHILMETYARNGDFEKITQIYNMLREDGIAPVPQTYVFLFECLARRKSSNDVLDLVKKSIEDAAMNKISLNDIFVKSVFVRDQKQLILEIIHKIDKDFEPLYSLPNLNYSNKLLQALNKDSFENNDQQSAFTPEELRSFGSEQIEIELKSCVTIHNISKSLTESSAIKEFCRKKLDELYATWHREICKAFKSRLTELSDGNISMCLTLLKPEQYVDLTLDCLKDAIQKYGNGTIGTPTYGLLGKRIKQRHEWELKKADGIIEKTKAIYDKYCDKITLNQTSSYYRREWQYLELADSDFGLGKEYGKWPHLRAVQVGKFLFELIKENIKIDENLFEENAKGTSYAPILGSYETKRQLEHADGVHPVLIRLYQGAELQTINFTTDQLPMLCPPVPWISTRRGGYLLTQTPFIRSKDDTTEILTLLNQVPVTELYPILDNLNQPSNVPWRINTRILDIATEIYNQKSQHNEKILNEQEIMRNSQNQFAHKLSVAHYLRNKTFWFPHNRDERGRIHALPTVLNYIQTDLQRSLLMFHQKKALGADGLKWLKLYCINLTKLKSNESLDDRIKYADQCMDDILDSADNPLTGRLWWLNSVKPFLTLACCMEIADAIRSPDASKFLSGIPIHQDGSCNGLQHYAGLSRNRGLAENVNLSCKEKPQDIYTVAIDLMERYRAEEAMRGLGIAKCLEGHLTRHLLKLSIANKINGIDRTRIFVEKGLSKIPNFPKKMIKKGGIYLESLHNAVSPLVFKPALDIRMWLKKSAFYISEECGKPIQWITPLNIPVVIPHESMSDTRQIINSKFPAYLIMSLESTHMILTSLNCASAGLTFISEHDSYATHASTVTQMNRICREQFLMLYSQPVLENLSTYFCENYLLEKSSANGSAIPKSDNVDSNQTDSNESESVHIFKQFPKIGDFDLREVLNSDHFFH